jgi:hypothetical protein
MTNHPFAAFATLIRNDCAEAGDPDACFELLNPCCELLSKCRAAAFFACIKEASLQA